MRAVIERAYRIPQSRLFRVPISPADFPDYGSVVQRPVDLAAIRDKIRDRRYPRIEDFLEDLRLVFANCERFFENASEIGLAAKEFEAEMRRQCLAFGLKL
jgi:bromodomain-containing factor 1